MKVISIQDVQIDACVQESQDEGVVITKNGEPVAVLVGVEGMDLDQVALCQSPKFWALIKERRSQKTISRAELEQRLSQT